MQTDIANYHTAQSNSDRTICERLFDTINQALSSAESKLWHAHPVWFLNGNPIVGYSKLKDGVRLLFWSGMGFDEPELKPGSGKFQDASITYTSVEQIDEVALRRWLAKAQTIQWDYKNIVKNKGVLHKL